MNKNRALGLFVVVAVVQLAVPASMIIPREAALQSGALYNFRCQPVDPFDAFRGRYVRIGVQANTAPLPTGFRPDPGERVFAVLGKDSEGFATISELRRYEAPEGDYLKVEVRQVVGDSVRLVMPFDRYYMPEDLAPEAERAYWRTNRVGASPAYIAVRVKNGVGVIEDLYLDGMPVREYLELHSEDVQ